MDKVVSPFCFRSSLPSTRLCQKHLLNLDDVISNDVLGFDSILLFLCADISAPILTKCYNVSIETQCVISDWKLPKVTPIYIRERVARMARVTIDLYVGHIMKIFEKEIQLQVMVYLEVNNLITSDQSAYRNQHNTHTDLHTVVDDCLHNISDGNLTGVCSNFQKNCRFSRHTF